MDNKKRILILRFGAFGDVTMTIPVIASFLKAYPDKEIVFVSRDFAAGLVEPFDQIKFFLFEPSSKHRGIKGLWRLFCDLRTHFGSFDCVLDLHNVLRTKILTLLFRIKGIPVYKINKGRSEKKALTRKSNKVFKPLKSTFERYQDVFLKAGMHFSINGFNGSHVFIRDGIALPHSGFNSPRPKIGVAPFAGHPWKAWPEKYVKELIVQLANKGYSVFLFGGKGKEQEKLEEWSQLAGNVYCLAGVLSLQEELTAMSLLDVMVSMDSANMHLARLVNTKVVSLWGATHPYAGFYGYEMPESWAVQIDLDCRPCSVFGNKSCHRGDFACMNGITISMVLNKIDSIIQRMEKP